jgi:hypothetical protein
MQQYLLYVARSREFTPLAALALALGHGRGGITTCKSALLLSPQPSRPVLHELVDLQCAAEQLRLLAIKQAAYDARRRKALILDADFEPAPLCAFPRWAHVTRVPGEALIAVAEHLGDAQAFGWLRGSATPRQ